QHSLESPLSCNQVVGDIATIKEAAERTRLEVIQFVEEFNSGESPDSPEFNAWYALICGHVAYSLRMHELAGQRVAADGVADYVGAMLAPLVMASWMNADTPAVVRAISEARSELLPVLP